MLRKRVITALWGVPVVIVAIWFNEPLPWFTILAAVWGLLAVLEFYSITGVIKVRLLAFSGIFWTLLFIVHPHCTYDYVLPVLSAPAVLLSLVFLAVLRRKVDAVRHWAWSLAGIVYVGLLLSYLVALRIEADKAWLFLAIFATFGSDTFAYFIGKAVGRHKLAPSISPGKTWEGAFGGLIGAVIISLLFTLSTPLQLPLNYSQAVLLGLLISIFGQIGDLVESFFKRRMNVKESGNLMPGHGGLLDRMDSIVFAGIVVYVYYICFTA
jgi:phosphatidate cytidylyltransferase